MPGRVAELMTRLRGSLATVLPEVGGALRRLLPDPEARASLADPIAANVQDTFAQLQQLLEREFPEGTLEPGVVVTAKEAAEALHKALG